MRKTAIFVEGQTELILVREYLLRYFEYKNIDVQCRTLFTDGKFKSAEYDYLNNSAGFHFQIINVGGDTAVLPRMLRREKYMWAAGYDKIVGLRDMFSEDYTNLSKTIDISLNEKIIHLNYKVIEEKAEKPTQVLLCFAIMETEAWILGLYEIFERLDTTLTAHSIKESLGFDLENIDPENTFLNPAKTLDDIFQIAGRNYSKKKGDVEGIMALCSKNDFEDLLGRSACSTFNVFHKAVLEA